MRKSQSKSYKKWIFVGILAGIMAFSFTGGPSDAQIRSRIVRIVSDKGMCSGEQVRAPSGQDYILTAGHCDGLKSSDGKYNVITEDGKTLSRREVAEDPNSDLLLLEGIPGVRGLDIGKYTWQGETVRTFTHGSNFDTYKTEGQLIQLKMISIPLFPVESDSDAARCSTAKLKLYPNYGICALQVVEQASTAFIAPGSSGGAIVDSSGDLVGVASAGDGVGFFYFVTLLDIRSFLNNY